MWMAPNLVTMIGTGAIMFTTAVQVFFAPHLSEASPAWVYLLSAFGLFFYQTMDALDGKQARRTGASSPLGQLFDHGMFLKCLEPFVNRRLIFLSSGCDALSTILTVINTAAVCQVGPGWLVYVALSSVSITFYLAQWEEYHTGVMSCGNGLYGVTEGQLTVVAAQLLTAVLGPAIWTTQIPGLAGVTLTHVLLVALVGSNIVLAYSNITNVLTAKPDAIPKSELGNKHVSKPLAVSQLIPIAILLALGSLWIGGPDAEDYAAYPVVFLFAIGIGYVLFSVRAAWRTSPSGVLRVSCEMLTCLRSYVDAHDCEPHVQDSVLTSVACDHSIWHGHF